MALPYFYVPELADDQIRLDEPTSKHIIQVLRMNADEELLLTDGRGGTAKARITEPNRKRCVVRLLNRQAEERNGGVRVAISPTKNASRFEWFLEKATEIGVREIIPLLCSRTERSRFRTDRWKGILLSAMLQSQQAWLPLLHEPTEFDSFIPRQTEGNLYIAHCLEEENAKKLLTHKSSAPGKSTVLIGPEGDFTAEEIRVALANNFEPVSLGSNRLRTETAGIVAAVILSQHPV